MNNIIFITYPRSGHHLLADIINDISNAGYCEYYNCCSTIPCKKGNLLQKNHDIGLNLEVPDNFKTVLQLRNPYDAIWSRHKLYTNDKETSFTERFKAHYPGFKDFVNKWLGNTDVVVDYDDLMNNPYKKIKEVLDLLEWEGDFDLSKYNIKKKNEFGLSDKWYKKIIKPYTSNI